MLSELKAISDSMKTIIYNNFNMQSVLKANKLWSNESSCNIFLYFLLPFLFFLIFKDIAYLYTLHIDYDNIMKLIYELMYERYEI